MTDIFVFGSNRQGRHGMGAALCALDHHGAIYGQPTGRQGDSYAIVTKELRSSFQQVSLSEVEEDIAEFIQYALNHPSDTFNLTRIGCGLAGFAEEEIAPLFTKAPINVLQHWLFHP